MRRGDTVQVRLSAKPLFSFLYIVFVLVWLSLRFFAFSTTDHQVFAINAFLAMSVGDGLLCIALAHSSTVHALEKFRKNRNRNKKWRNKVAKRSPISLNSTREPPKLPRFRASFFLRGWRSLF